MSGASVSSATAASCPKVSMFASKTGFVIPKNKLAGSLVPRFRANKKFGSDDSVNEESAKPGQRKTKWGSDLTQDAAVRKGRSLLIRCNQVIHNCLCGGTNFGQTRVDQLAQLLKSKVTEWDENLDSQSTTTQAEDNSSSQIIDREKLKLLDLEKREAIGEILKLNPSYKAPPYYKPLLKEDKVITKSDLKRKLGPRSKFLASEKGEVIQSDGNDLHNSCEEIYVHITAETLHKVDAAISVIEPLITSVSGNLGIASMTSSKACGQQDVSSDLAHAREGDQNFVASLQPPQQGQSQFAGPRFVGNPSLPGPQNPNQSNPGVIPSSNPPPPSSSVDQSFLNYNPSNAPPFGPQATPIVSPGMSTPSPLQLLQNAAMARPSPVGGLVANPSPPFLPHPSAPVSSVPPFPGGQPLQPQPATIAGTGMPSLPQGPLSGRPFMRADGPMNMMQVGQRMGLGAPPQPASSPQFALQNPVGARLNPPNVPPIISPGVGPRQSHPSTSDFTFQPNRPPPSQGFGHPAPHQAGSFRPPIPDSRPFPQAFPRPPMGNHAPQHLSFPPWHPLFEGSGPHAHPNAFPPSAERGFNSAPLMRTLGPLLGRPGNAREGQLNFLGHMGQPPSQQFGHHDPRFSGRPALGHGRPQFYDPFLPTTANNTMKQHQGGGNSGGGRRQENDPEYEDLMTSVGVE